MIKWDRNRKYARTILEAIGLTPLVRLNRITQGRRTEIFVKLEFLSPTSSLKDRIYAFMISRAEKRGELRPGMTILECSTGNAGISCALVAALKGYPCIIVMPEGMSEERKKMIRALGAELIFTPGGESDVDLALQKLDEIRRQNPDQFWVPGQFDNPDNIEAHFKTTGPEIWEQVGGQLDAFVATAGSGGSLTGIGRYLRRKSHKIKIYAAEPAECPLLSRGQWGAHRIEGISDGFIPRDLDLSLLNGVIVISSQDAVEMARRLAREEGIFCGLSSGANVAAAVKLAQHHPEIKRIVTIINDTGERYFSTELWGTPKKLTSPKRERPLDAYTREQLEIYRPTWEIIP